LFYLDGVNDLKGVPDTVPTQQPYRILKKKLIENNGNITTYIPL